MARPSCANSRGESRWLARKAISCPAAPTALHRSAKSAGGGGRHGKLAGAGAWLIEYPSGKLRLDQIDQFPDIFEAAGLVGAKAKAELALQFDQQAHKIDAGPIVHFVCDGRLRKLE